MLPRITNESVKYKQCMLQKQANDYVNNDFYRIISAYKHIFAHLLFLLVTLFSQIYKYKQQLIPNLGRSANDGSWVHQTLIASVCMCVCGVESKGGLGGRSPPNLK